MTHFSKTLLLVIIGFAYFVGPHPNAHAAITSEGSVGNYVGFFPPVFVNEDPNGWTSSSGGLVGGVADGSITVDNGSDLYTHSVSAGYESNTKGVVTISGVGSTWTSNYVELGYFGNGILNIIDGGVVNVSHTTELARYVDFAQGSIYFNNGTLNTKELFASPSQLSGSGVINTRGLVSDFNFVFDSTHGLNQTFTPTGTNIVINLNMQNSDNPGEFGVGYKGNGSMLIKDGVKLRTYEAFIGYYTGSTGIGTVDGPGSEWTITSHLHCVSAGSGSLNITGGGKVNVFNEIDLGGGQRGLLAIDVGFGSQLNVSTNGIINNDNVIRILAGAGATADQAYNPISYGELRESGGIRQYVGGKPNGPLGIMVSPVLEGTAGNAVMINDRSTVQRVLFHDSEEGKTGWNLGASFLYKTAGALSLTATTSQNEELNALKLLLPSDRSVLGSWDFANISGYTTNEPAYLSFDIGANYSRDDLQVWSFKEGKWDTVTMPDLTCNGGYASFTAYNLNGYAITAIAVPEPTTFVLLGMCSIGLFFFCVIEKLGQNGGGKNTNKFPCKLSMNEEISQSP